MPVSIEEMSAVAEEDNRIYGVAIAQVISNVDMNGLGRVQLQLPWLPDLQPWARVAVLLAGDNRGTYFIPQIGDEVLVAFNQGDVREPYVIGCLWNGQDRPPASGPTDPTAKRIIRTPLGHVLEFDDILQSIKITTNMEQKVQLTATGIEISTSGGTASVKLDSSGSITIQGAQSIALKAPSITLDGATVSIKGTASVSLESSGTCNIQGSLVKIN